MNKCSTKYLCFEPKVFNFFSKFLIWGFSIASKILSIRSSNYKNVYTSEEIVCALIPSSPLLCNDASLTIISSLWNINHSPKTPHPAWIQNMSIKAMINKTGSKKVPTKKCNCIPTFVFSNFLLLHQIIVTLKNFWLITLPFRSWCVSYSSLLCFLFVAFVHSSNVITYSRKRVIFDMRMIERAKRNHHLMNTRLSGNSFSIWKLIVSTLVILNTHYSSESHSIPLTLVIFRIVDFWREGGGAEQ